MTTMTLGNARLGFGGWPRVRWGSVVHGSVLLALLAGAAAVWATLALLAAVLITPVETMSIFERQGAWGLLDALRHGTTIIVSAALSSAEQGRR